ncbi:MAG: hypothetical protein LBN27_08710 [Prevotellaceae bacterium]|jgi:hypothetical protein|nr:hypothetical protein [Prevotellaceae bacterium]
MKKYLMILVAVFCFGLSANAISARVAKIENRGSYTYIKYEINPEGKSGWYNIRITWTDTSGKVQIYEKKMAGSVSSSNSFDRKLDYGVPNYSCCAKVEVWW